MYIYIYTHIHIYIYVYREREKCINVGVHRSIYLYTYIYIYMHQPRETGEPAKIMRAYLSVDIRVRSIFARPLAFQTMFGYGEMGSKLMGPLQQ